MPCSLLAVDEHRAPVCILNMIKLSQFQSQVVLQSWTIIMHLASLKEQTKGRKQKQLLSSCDSLKPKQTPQNSWRAVRKPHFYSGASLCQGLIWTYIIRAHLTKFSSSGEIFSKQSSLFPTLAGILQTSGEYWVIAIGFIWEFHLTAKLEYVLSSNVWTTL